MNARAMTYRKRTLAAALLPLLLLACSAEPPPLEGAAIGGPFTLIDKDRQTVRWSDFDGKYRIVYFGYSFCPDVCPLDMQVLAQGLEQYAKEHPRLAEEIVPIFISIDPARDTPEVVGEFSAAFSPRIVGLTGSPQQVSAAAKEFAIYFTRGTETSGGYLMDHSRIAYLMGRDGKPIAILPVDQKPEDVATELAKWVR